MDPKQNGADRITTRQDSTLSDVRPPDRPDRGFWLRRAAVGLMVVILVAAGGGLLGVRSATASAENDGYQLDVTYAAMARSGLDVPLTIRVRAPQPFQHDVVIGISADYFRMFETQGFFPDPSATTSDGATIYLTFDAPPTGNELVVDYDAYIQPAAQIGKAAVIDVFIDGIRRVSVPIHTRLVP